MKVKRWQEYEWKGCHLLVIRVAEDQSWADIFVYQRDSGATWCKRQPLPLPPEAQLIT